MGQQHPRAIAGPQRRVGFGEDCTRKSHQQLCAVEESTVICDSQRAEERQSRDFAVGKHHRLTSEKGLSLCKQAPPRLPVVPQSSCILGRTIATGQGSRNKSLGFAVALPAMLTGGVSTIASSARLLRLPVQVQQGCSSCAEGPGPNLTALW